MAECKKLVVRKAKQPTSIKMKAEIRAKINRWIWRQRACLIIAVGIGIALLVLAQAYYLESWDVGEPRLATVTGYEGNISGARRSAQAGGIRPIVRLADGSEGLVETPFPEVFIGDRILVRKETSKMFGFRRFRFVGCAKN